MNDRSTPEDAGTSAEPDLTLKNSMTIKGEEILAGDETDPEIETSTRTADRVIPTSYGAAGGMTPDTDEN